MQGLERCQFANEDGFLRSCQVQVGTPNGRRSRWDDIIILMLVAVTMVSWRWEPVMANLTKTQILDRYGWFGLGVPTLPDLTRHDQKSLASEVSIALQVQGGHASFEGFSTSKCHDSTIWCTTPCWEGVCVCVRGQCYFAICCIVLCFGHALSSSWQDSKIMNDWIVEAIGKIHSQPRCLHVFEKLNFVCEEKLRRRYSSNYSCCYHCIRC